MRHIVIFALFTASCASSPGGSRPSLPKASADSKVRVVWNQYKGASSVFILENLAGRDLVELRSRRLETNKVPVAFVPDDVLAKMLKEFQRLDYADHAVPRPADPRTLGAKGEITIIDENNRQISLLRVPALGGTQKQVAAAQCYGECARTFNAVWSHYPPQMQATTSKSAFGVKRADYERGR